jgi:glycosyltransferase involved in cell wall biosynthesis
MKIAQVAPLMESVPPRLYGGTERIVSYITEELVEQGHDVTLFASGDSITSARLVSPCAQALRLNPDAVDALPLHFLQLEQVFARLAQFDVIHFHTDYLHFPVSRRHRFPHVTTLHGRLDIPELGLLYDCYRDEPVVSISDNQRRPLPQARWMATVHHGLPPENFPWTERAADGESRYLAFLGRISPEKRVDVAIEIARRTGMRLKIAAKIDRADREYFDATIAPLLAHAHVEFIGEIGEEEKATFLGGAHALLFPIDWEEPFGLVMIEAMACGTPVIAFRRGSVPEVIDDGVTGFIVDSLDDAVAATARVPELSRRACRQTFDRRFTSVRMAADYMAVYRRLLSPDLHTDVRPDTALSAHADSPNGAKPESSRRSGSVVHLAERLPIASSQ